MSRGNFRLLTRLVTQVERILKVNQSEIVSKEIVTAARESLLIGQG
jgi:Holliday junction resolvasome RuvABC ATP-dependent DNA helicase subunit